MATGVLAPIPWAGFESVYAGNPIIDNGASQPPYPPVYDEKMLKSDDFDGPLNDVSPPSSSRAGLTVDGVRCPQFVDDYYYRVYVTPAAISLGNLVSTQIRTFQVWNAYFTPQLNSALNVAGDTTGVILTEPVVPPYQYGPLEVQEYQIQFELNGPSAIQLTYDWNFPSDNPVLEIGGNRAIIWSIDADWSETVLEQYEWSTQIIEVDNGDEYRHRIRTNPRRSLEFQVLINEKEKRWMERYLWAWKSRVFSVPLWTDCTFIDGDLGIGNSIIPVDTTDYKSFKVGGIAIIFGEFDTVEAVEIAAVNPTSIELVRPTLQAWTDQTKIYPALIGRMREDIEITQPTADVTLAEIRFEFVDNEEITPVEAPTAYEDGFVLERQPDRSTDLSLTYQSKLGIVDYGIAPPLVDERASYPDVVIASDFAEDTRADIWFWKEWLHARAGKWSKFYQPSWGRDFTLVTDIADNDNVIEVEDLEYEVYYNLHPVKRHIAIYTRDNQVYYRRITAVAKGAAGIERLTISAQLGVSYTVAEVKMISFLHPVRLDSDRVEFEWSSNGVIQFGLNTRSIPQ